MSRGNHYAVQADPARNPHFNRRWTEPPVCEGFKTVGKAAADIVNAAAVNAVAHWLRQADHIMRMASLRWADFIPGRAA